MHAFWGLIRQDLRLAARQGGDIGLVLGFFVLAVVLFPFGVGPEPEVLQRIGAGIIWVAALLAAALAVSAAMAATILERRQEVGLMKSLGAGNSAVASLFLTEAAFLAIAGGLIGFLAGAVLAHRIGQRIFGSAIVVHPVVLAVVLFAAVLVTFLGSAGAVRKAMQFDPAVVLRGDA